MSRVRVVIHGRVQGVWFRGWTQEEARRRSLDGWVMNRRDGAVEAVFQGEPAEVEAMVEACWQGPPHALVAEVELLPEDPDEGPLKPGFHIRRASWL